MAGQIGDPGLYPGGAGDAGDKNFWELNPPASQTGKLTTGIAQTWTTDGSTEIFHARNNAGVAEFGIYGSPFDYTTVHTPALNYALVWNGTAFAATNIGGAGPYVQLAPATRQTGAAISLKGNAIGNIVDIAALSSSTSVFVINSAGNFQLTPTATTQIGVSITSTTLTTGALLQLSAPTGKTALSIASGNVVSAAALVWQLVANTAAAFQFRDNVNAYYTLNTSTGTDNISAHAYAVGTAPSYNQSATSSYSLMGLSAYTWTGTAASTTVTALNGLQLNIAAPTIAFSSANTVTTASTLYIGGAPSAGTNATITNAFGLYIDKGAAMGLAGATSGFIGMKAAATTTSYSITWPAAQASGTQVLQNNGSGTLSWATVTSGASWSGLTNPTAALALTMAAADTTTFTLQQTTQTGFTWSSSTLTSGSLAAFTSTSTALAAGNALVSISSSGANTNANITTVGLSVSVTNTGTSSNDVCIQVLPSGSATQHRAINIAGTGITAEYFYGLLTDPTATQNTASGQYAMVYNNAVFTQAAASGIFYGFYENSHITVNAGESLSYYGYGVQPVITNNGTLTTYGLYMALGTASTNTYYQYFSNGTGIVNIAWAATSGAAMEWLDTGNSNAIAMALNTAAVTTGAGYILSIDKLRTTGGLSTAITVGASPFTYTNSDTVVERVAVFGGAVTNIDHTDRLGTAIYNSGTLTAGEFVLAPGETLVVTYTTAPTMNKAIL